METATLRSILEYAVRAPSTHNTQPWLFKISEGKELEIFYDPQYVLKQADKELRDLHISIGCMLENLRLASMHFGYNAEISFGPFSENFKKAHVVFVQKSLLSDLDKRLFETINKRVNARGVFSPIAIPDIVKKQIIEMSSGSKIKLTLIESKEDIKKIGMLTEQSMHMAYENKLFRKEMSGWMNSNISSKKEGIPGFALKMPFFLSFFIPFFVRFFNMGNILGRKNYESISSAPLLVMFSGEDTELSWIETGILAEKVMLFLQSLDFQTSIFVGAIEMGDFYKEIMSITKNTTRPQFLFGAGKILGMHKITPRHDIDRKIIF